MFSHTSITKNVQVAKKHMQPALALADEDGGDEVAV